MHPKEQAIHDAAAAQNAKTAEERNAVDKVAMPQLSETQLDAMAAEYEAHRAKYVGGVEYHPNNAVAVRTAMQKAIAAVTA